MIAQFEYNNTDTIMGNSAEEYYIYSEHYSQRKLVQDVIIIPIWIAKMDNTFSKKCCKHNEQILVTFVVKAQLTKGSMLK